MIRKPQQVPLGAKWQEVESELQEIEVASFQDYVRAHFNAAKGPFAYGICFGILVAPVLSLLKPAIHLRGILGIITAVLVLAVALRILYRLIRLAVFRFRGPIRSVRLDTSDFIAQASYFMTCSLAILLPFGMAECVAPQHGILASLIPVFQHDQTRLLAYYNDIFTYKSTHTAKEAVTDQRPVYVKEDSITLHSSAPIEQQDPILVAESEMLARLTSADASNELHVLVDVAGEFTKAHPKNHLVWMHATLAYLKAGHPEQSLASARECERLLEDLPEEKKPSKEQLSQFWSQMGAAHLECSAPYPALACFKKAAEQDATFAAFTERLADSLANLAPSPDALSKAEQLDDVPPDFYTSFSRTLGRDGVIVLADPKYEEIRGKLLGITTAGGVAMTYLVPNTGEKKLLVFPKGTVARIFNGNEVEMSRYHQIMQAGFDAYPIFRDFGSVCSLGFEPTTLQLVGHHSRLAPYAGGRDQLILNDSLRIDEVIKYWETLDQKQSSLAVPYTWTREFASACRKESIKNSTDEVYNVFEYVSMRKRGIARFLNIPNAGPYSRYEATDVDRLGEGLFDSFTLLSPKQFAKLSPEEQRNAFSAIGISARFVKSVVDLDKQHSDTSLPEARRSAAINANSRKVTGILADKNGKPMPRNTQLRINDQTDVLREFFPAENVFTDANGRFSFNVPRHPNGPDPTIAIWLYANEGKLPRELWRGRLDRDKDLQLKE